MGSLLKAAACCAAAAVALSLGAGAAWGKTDMVTVCHGGKTIEVSEKSWPAHEAHGDTRGACVEGGGGSEVEGGSETRGGNGPGAEKGKGKEKDDPPAHDAPPGEPPAGAGGGSGPSGTHPEKAEPQPSQAGPGPDCRGAVFTTDAADSVLNKNGYAFGEDVYLRGKNFDSGVSLRYVIVKVNSGHGVMTSGTIGAPGAGGGFFELIWDDPAASGHEYQVVVTWELTLASGRTKSCRKSDNFFFLAGGGDDVGGGDDGDDGDDGDGDEGGPGGGDDDWNDGGGSGDDGDPDGGDSEHPFADDDGDPDPAEGNPSGEAAAGLPFTGLPLWLVAVAAGALLASGLALRRGARRTTG